ncbi:helix-turn-helix domain-containing protein [Oceanicaulis sp. MMSF_3324]|uniref:AraC family transcriptional regulator n=1 Tax=Oceanicaulis sp. MMSF_3324 TaxID=3046702 RepID=UPI00273DE1ED|nr:helix-turn-helix domain-containing protein [Oceanicaulis sp. MMSF_3324]
MTVQWISRLGPYSEARARLGRSRRLWRHQAAYGAETPPHRVLPETRLSLVTERHYSRSGTLLDEQHWVFGPIITPRLYAPAPGTVLDGVFLAPEEAICVLGVRPDELVDAIVPQSDFPALNLQAEPPQGAANALAVWAAGMIRRTRGQVRAARLARHAGVSDRHLHRVMTGRLGLGPKALANQIRTLTAIEHADQSPHPDWAQIAYAHGYSDQAHLSRSVRAMSGLSPSALHAERSVESEIFKTRTPV